MKVLATFWAIFSQTHLVTLVLSFISISVIQPSQVRNFQLLTERCVLGLKSYILCRFEGSTPTSKICRTVNVIITILLIFSNLDKFL
jgi:hypothetical protein